MTPGRRHRVLVVLGALFLAIAAERLVNMLIIGRPFGDFTVRAWVFQWFLAAGIVLLLVWVVLDRDR